MDDRILVAVDLDAESAEQVLTKACARFEVESGDTRFKVLHVVDPTNLAYVVDPTMTGKMMRSNVDQAVLVAREALIKLCAPFNIAPEQIEVRYGRIAHEVHEYLQEGGFDTLVLGTHGRSGWHRILGSVACSILHGVTVDTWVVKVGEKASV